MRFVYLRQICYYSYSSRERHYFGGGCRERERYCEGWFVERERERMMMCLYEDDDDVDLCFFI